MAKPFYDLTTLPGIEPVVQDATFGSAGLAAIYRAASLTDIDVVGRYAWTLTPPTPPDSCSEDARSNAPVIELREFEVNESTISRQLQFYLDTAFSSSRDYLAPYDDLFPKDLGTNIIYKFPYFSDINFEVNTPEWKSLDEVEKFYSGAKNLLTGGISTFLGEGAGDLAGKILGGIEGAVKGGAALAYPKIGIMDRPRLWSNHQTRSITFSFPLFNTHNFDPNKPEWVKNRELCWLLVVQNLYNKRSFITGIPPVFYEVLIPGQHFSIAACVTNLTVYNRGNMRLLTDPQGNYVNVPDVYEVQMTLTDMVMPSKNQMHAIFDEEVRSACREAST